MSEGDDLEAAMTTTTPRPIVPAEVTNYVTNLELAAEFRGLLAGIPEVFPEALRVECEVDPGIPEEVDPVVIINIALPYTEVPEPTPLSRWADWELAHYPGNVLMHFTALFSYPLAAHDRT